VNITMTTPSAAPTRHTHSHQPSPRADKVGSHHQQTAVSTRKVTVPTCAAITPSTSTGAIGACTSTW